MSQTVAYYRHPLLDEYKSIMYISGKTPQEFTFVIEGESATFGLKRLMELDEKNGLAWENELVHQKFRTLNQTLENDVEPTPIVIYDKSLAAKSNNEKTEQSQELIESFNPNKIKFLTMIAAALVVLVILTTYFGFIKPWADTAFTKKSAETSQTNQLDVSN